jgi:putative addiction module CopG family antidote
VSGRVRHCARRSTVRAKVSAVRATFRRNDEEQVVRLSVLHRVTGEGAMAERQTRTVSLSRELDQFVADKVASGLYSSASEVVRAGLRQLAENEALTPIRQGDQPSSPGVSERSRRS